MVGEDSGGFALCEPVMGEPVMGEPVTIVDGEFSWLGDTFRATVGSIFTE